MVIKSKLREAAGYFTQRQVAERFGVSPALWTYYLTVQAIPRPTRRYQGSVRRYYIATDVENIKTTLDSFKKDEVPQ